MAREKKDGQHINYYIERRIYERLKEYANDKGQSMTTAIERILDDVLPPLPNDKESEESRTE